MRIKKIAALLFAAVLLFSTLAAVQITAMAEAPEEALSLSFALTAKDGKAVVMTEQGAVITVSFLMRRTDADEGYTMNGFQNYIHYDLDFFELVDGSVVCHDPGMATAKKQNSITYGEIVQCQSMGSSYDALFVFCSFRLRVIGEAGSGMVYHGEIHAFDGRNRPIAVTEQTLRVIIDVGCTHASKTRIGGKAASCEERGWDAYYTCDDCDALFDKSGEALISDIPYIESAHRLEDDYIADGQGHWRECGDCGTRAEYAVHSGGTATCTSPRRCTACRREYGAVDEEAHTGDTTCTECGAALAPGQEQEPPGSLAPEEEQNPPSSLAPEQEQDPLGSLAPFLTAALPWILGIVGTFLVLFIIAVLLQKYA